MANKNDSPGIGVVAIADLLDGYISDNLSNSNFQSNVKNLLARLDPDKSLSRSMVTGFKNRLIRKARDPRIRDKSRLSINWGRIRGLDDGRLGDLLKPKPVFLLKDDVGDPVIPNYPNDTNFTIKYEGIFCKSRTGDRWIFGPSDEIYVISSVVNISNGNNEVRTERHPLGTPNKIYGDVDGGETRIGPVAACWFGKANEITLISTIMEQDEGDPDAYKDQINALVELAALIAKAFGVSIPDVAKEIVVDAVNWILGSEDDNVGTEFIVISPDQLKLMANSNGIDFFNNGNTIGILYNQLFFHNDSGEYYSFYTVEADRAPTQIPPGINPNVLVEPLVTDGSLIQL